MKVLLTHAYFLEEDNKELKIMRPYVPLGILYLSSFLEINDVDNAVFDTTFSSNKELEKYLIEEKPEFVGIYVNLMTKLNVLRLISFLKKNLPDTHITLGGPEVKHSAENFLRYGADFIVIGEGEETTLELVNFLSSKNSPHNQLDNIAGIAFLRDDQFIQTSERKIIKNLQELPEPNRKKINLELYLDAWKKRHGTSTVSISTMRGCPYTCKWCSRAVYGLSYRRRSPRQVVKEMHSIQTHYHPDTLWFVDDVFTISHKWLREFNLELKKNEIHIPYECITRADRMNEEVIQLLKESGCFRVWIGAESGSQKVIDLMDRRVDVNHVREMITLTNRYGIESGTFIMLGYPGETEKDIRDTIHHLKDSNPDYFTITVAYPINGTDLYQEVEAIQTTSLSWNSSNDRDIDFKRTYPRKYYDYAVRHVVNEVNFYKSKNKRKPLKTVNLKLKSLIAQMGMWWTRTSY